MKKVFKLLAISPMLLVFVLIIIFFMIPNLATPSESIENSIVTVLGIDYDKEYELSFLTFIPSPGESMVEKYSVISTKGDSLAKIIKKAGLQLGKKVRLAHTKTAVLGKGVVEKDLLEVLSYLTRENSLPKSCMLISTDQTAKDMIEYVQENDKDAGEKLQNLSRFNTEAFYWGESSVESFFNDSLSPLKCSFLGYMTLKSKIEDDTVIINKGAEQEENTEKELSNTGDIMIFKNGKKIGFLLEKDLNGLNWLNKSVKNNAFTITLDNNDEETFFVKQKKVRHAVKIENNIPIYGTNIILKVDRVEIKGEINSNSSSVSLSELSNEKKEKIEELVKKEFNRGLSVIKSFQTDIINVYQTFYQRERSAFKRFLGSLENEEDFLNNIVFEISVRVEAD